LYNTQDLDLLFDNGSESVSETEVLASFEALIQGLEGEEDAPKEIENVSTVEHTAAVLARAL
jgi:hypothetical protein